LSILRVCRHLIEVVWYIFFVCPGFKYLFLNKMFLCQGASLQEGYRLPVSWLSCICLNGFL